MKRGRGERNGAAVAGNEGGSGVEWLEMIGALCGEVGIRLNKIKWTTKRLVCCDVFVRAKLYAAFPLTRVTYLAHTFQFQVNWTSFDHLNRLRKFSERSD